ncbi:MAG: hypothetical protein ABI273_08385 [Lacunisphaera sp.]
MSAQSLISNGSVRVSQVRSLANQEWVELKKTIGVICHYLRGVIAIIQLLVEIRVFEAHFEILSGGVLNFGLKGECPAPLKE